ncbi:MAG: hypothetical protein IPJ79_06315 [Bacteroidetes bacterium]|nr:hypothetical protein [Bacteroidota bacterium]
MRPVNYYKMIFLPESLIIRDSIIKYLTREELLKHYKKHSPEKIPSFESFMNEYFYSHYNPGDFEPVKTFFINLEEGKRENEDRYRAIENEIFQKGKCYS